MSESHVRVTHPNHISELHVRVTRPSHTSVSHVRVTRPSHTSKQLGSRTRLWPDFAGKPPARRPPIPQRCRRRRQICPAGPGGRFLLFSRARVFPRRGPAGLVTTPRRHLVCLCVSVCARACVRVSARRGSRRRRRGVRPGARRRRTGSGMPAAVTRSRGPPPAPASFASGRVTRKGESDARTRIDLHR